jgi:hypothetical protein
LAGPSVSNLKVINDIASSPLDLTNPIPFVFPIRKSVPASVTLQKTLVNNEFLLHLKIQNDQRPFTLSLSVDQIRARWQPIPITSNRRNLCASSLNFCATSLELVSISSSPALQIAPLNKP